MMLVKIERESAPIKNIHIQLNRDEIRYMCTYLEQAKESYKHQGYLIPNALDKWIALLGDVK